MGYDFDTVVDRRNTNSLKYDFAEERGRSADILPLWVADMDFPAAPGIVARLQQCIGHGIYGYSESKEAYAEAVSRWFGDYFDWRPDHSWLVKTPGVVFAIAAAIRAFTERGDYVLIQSPVYYPFREVIEDNGRRIAASSLVLERGCYQIDFDDIEKQLSEKQIKLFLLCSPHNPVGRVWRREELLRLGKLCLKYNVRVVSDEIHCDFTFPGHRHHVFASLSPALQDNAIICTSPSKSFNLAGLQVSNIFIANEQVRRTFQAEVAKTGYSQLNLPGLVAGQAAYETGREWLAEVKTYIAGNLAFLREYLERQLPRIKLIEPEGTYLIWLDCRELGLTDGELDELVEKKAGLWLDGGTLFGPEGSGFQRINLACPRQIVAAALERLRAAVQTVE